MLGPEFFTPSGILTVADLSIFDVLHTYCLALVPDCLWAFPALARFVRLVSTRSAIIALLESPEQLDICTYPSIRALPMLLCKPSGCGNRVGDCPFTHYVVLALRIAGLDHTVTIWPSAHLPACLLTFQLQMRPTSNAHKPAWLLDSHNGSLPCLVDQPASGDGSISGWLHKFKFKMSVTDVFDRSEQIAEHVLPKTERDADVIHAAAGLFPALARYLKNTDESVDSNLEELLNCQLTAVEELLLAVDDCPFASGAAPGHADCWLASKLYVLHGAGRHFKQFELDATRLPATAAYMQRMFKLDDFNQSKYSIDEMIVGWSEARTEDSSARREMKVDAAWSEAQSAPTQLASPSVECRQLHERVIGAVSPRNVIDQSLPGATNSSVARPQAPTMQPAQAFNPMNF